VIIILSLLENHSHDLLDLKDLSPLGKINYSILYENISYQLNNFSSEYAQSIIYKLIKYSRLHL
jgi:hypothetical protein